MYLATNALSTSLLTSITTKTIQKSPALSWGHCKNEEGALETNQIAGLDLRKTGLVVLSGCQSQLGRQTEGDDIVGLSSAFIYAGSPSVIASLWSVDDEATHALMVSFYSHLRDSPKRKHCDRHRSMFGGSIRIPTIGLDSC